MPPTPSATPLAQTPALATRLAAVAASVPPATADRGSEQPPAEAGRKDADIAALRSIERKLERWELQHLRDHAAQLAQQVELLQDELTLLRAQVAHADQAAEFWHEQVVHIQEGLADDLALAITPEGEMGVVHALGGTDA